MCCFFQAEDGIRDLVRSRGLGDVYKRQYVSDCVAATIAALGRPPDGSVFNIGGGKEITLASAIGILAGHLDVEPTIIRKPARHGDQRRTAADTTRARELLGWIPLVTPDVGLPAQADWVRSTFNLQ